MASSFTDHLRNRNFPPGDSRGGSLLRPEGEGSVIEHALSAAEYDPRSAAALQDPSLRLAIRQSCDRR
jgi:hypothetical protein